MTVLRALTTGPRMATHAFAGSVHSVFSRSCNITADDGRMFALLSAEHGNVPHGARLHTPADFVFSGALRVGDRCACNSGMLRFHAAGLAVQLKGARRWRARLDHLAADLSRPRVATALQVTRQTLQQHVVDQPRPLDHSLEAHRAALRQAVGAVEQREMKAAIGRLIGCGAGLTPAGDDVLIGFLAGLRALAGEDTKRRALLMFVSALIRNAAHATNSISRAYLLHACDGVFAEPLTLLAASIAAGDPPPRVAAAAGAALAIGATSGADGVRGLLDALACCG